MTESPKCKDCRHALRTDHHFAFWTCALVIHHQSGRVEWPESSCETQRNPPWYMNEACGISGNNFAPKPARIQGPSFLKRLLGL